MVTDSLYAPSKDAVVQAAEGRWVDIFSSLAPSLAVAQARPGKSFDCPVCGKTKGFRVFRKTAAGNSGGICQNCGIKHDGLALLQWINGWSFHAALQEVGSILSVEDPNGRHATGRSKPEPIIIRKVQVAPKGPSDKWINDMLCKMWKESVPLTDPQAEPARLYLRSRGILGWDREGLEAAVRFHPALSHTPEGGKGEKQLLPAIVARILDQGGKGVTMHRTYLTLKGQKAFGGEESKKMFAIPSNKTIRGGCIRTSKAEEVIDVAEGLETALAIETAKGVSVWPMVNSYLLEEFIPPEGVKAVRIWADKDASKAGEEAALKLKRRLWEMGIKARILLPPFPIPEGKKGIDWNDVLLAYGPTGFDNHDSYRAQR